MSYMFDKYFKPQGHQGQGKDINWCGRNQGGKRCNLCKYYAEFSTWSVDWSWYYLESYSDYFDWNGYRDGIHYRRSQRHCINHVRPVKYHTRGLSPNEVRSLLRRGCKPDRKCKCVSIIQRGFWYCPVCWRVLNNIANSRGQHIHDLMMRPRQELKEEMLILTLSGVL